MNYHHMFYYCWIVHMLFARKYELSSHMFYYCWIVHMLFARKYELSSYILLLLDSTYAFC